MVLNVLDNMKNLSLGTLIEKLHDAMASMAKNMGTMLDVNRRIVGEDDVKRLRKHILQKLEQRDDVVDNEKLLKMLELFASDDRIITIMRKDVEEWVKLLEQVSTHMAHGGNITDKEKDELYRINKLATEIKSIIRRER